MIFKYFTPVIYWILVLIWGYIFFFYLKKINHLDKKDKLLKLLLIILTIDAFRTLFESVYFGAWYTSLSGLIPIEIYNNLAKPEVVFFPKTINLIVAILILTMLIRKWLPSEIIQMDKINLQIETQISELLTANYKLKVANEIAEQKAIELKNQKRLFESMFNSISDGVVIANTHREIILVNNGMKTIFGYESKELVGKSTKILYDSDSLFNETGKKLFNKDSHSLEKSYLTYYKDKNNKIFPGETFGTKLFDTDEQWIGNLGIIRNVSEQQKMTEDLVITKQTYLDIFNTVSEAIYIQDETGTFIDVNKGAENIYGYTHEELVGKSPLLVAAPGLNDLDEVQRISSEVFKSGGSARFDFWAIRKNGEIFPKEVIINKGRYFGKEVLIATSRDISLFKKTEQELIRAKEKAEESDRLKSAFLANMSHEIRTPMNGILGFTALLKSSNINNEKHQKYIRIIEKSSARLLTTINDIIDISKIESGQMKISFSEMNINKEVEDLYAFFKPEADKKRIQLLAVNSITDLKSIVKTDQEKLYTILLNLIKNAIKFTKKGSVEFGCSNNENQLEFYVKDTGIGIPLERQPFVFDRFVQADIEDKAVYEGSGLGLAISKSYVEMLGGTIGLQSVEGIGSTFSFTIPYQQTTTKIIPEAINETLNDLEASEILALKILIVEDDIAAQLYLELLLTDVSKEILLADNGYKALNLVRENSDINLILMDIRIPEVNGYEVTHQIRQFNKEVIIIAQTAYALSGDREKALEAGCNDYISKPLNQEELFVKINKYFK